MLKRILPLALLGITLALPCCGMQTLIRCLQWQARTRHGVLT